MLAMGRALMSNPRLFLLDEPSLGLAPLLVRALFQTIRNIIVHSPVGRTYLAIRGSEALAESMGINSMWNKIVSFTVSAFFAGLAGALYASYHGFISPDTSNFHIGFDLLIYLLVGGAATMAGPIIGAFIMTLIPESLQFLLEYRIIFYGSFLIAVVIFLPRGLVGLWCSFIWPKIR